MHRDPITQATRRGGLGHANAPLMQDNVQVANQEEHKVKHKDNSSRSEMDGMSNYLNCIVLYILDLCWDSDSDSASCFKYKRDTSINNNVSQLSPHSLISRDAF